MKKTVFTLLVDNYAPEITEYTLPLIHNYAKRIGANFHIIKDRKFPGWPPVYEKLQIYELGQQMENDWNLFIDADAMVSPECPDVTELLQKDTVMHNGCDHATIRWKYDRFFRRDGRHIGSCNWFTLGSDWCIDLWKPLDDLTLEEATKNITLCISENNCGVMDSSHLIDDYTLSRNIAKFGLKFTTFSKLQDKLEIKARFLVHLYAVPNEKKVETAKKVMRNWAVIL